MLHWVRSNPQPLTGASLFRGEANVTIKQEEIFNANEKYLLHQRNCFIRNGRDHISITIALVVDKFTRIRTFLTKLTEY